MDRTEADFNYAMLYFHYGAQYWPELTLKRQAQIRNRHLRSNGRRTRAVSLIRRSFSA